MLKTSSVTKVFLNIFRKFLEQLFQRTQLMGCFLFHLIIPEKLLEPPSNPLAPSGNKKSCLLLRLLGWFK